jgi:transcription elongation factor Elf1
MDDAKYNRSVTLLCPTCGSDQFSYESGVDESIEMAKCASCGREMTKDDLISENSENISAHVDEMKKEVVDDIRAQFKNIFKK